MEKLTGGLKYCLREGCEGTVHPEDYPGYYPFCPKHKKSNKSYREWMIEKAWFDEQYKEFHSITTI